VTEFLTAISNFVKEILFFFVPWTVVPPDNRGYLVTLGRRNSVRPVSSGFHWHWPFNIQEILMYHYYWATVRMNVQSLTTANQISIQVAFIFKYRIRDGETYLFDIDEDEEYLEDIAMGAVADAVERRKWPFKAEDVRQEVLAELRKEKAFSIKSVRHSDKIQAKALRLFQE